MILYNKLIFKKNKTNTVKKIHAFITLDLLTALNECTACYVLFCLP